MQRPWWTDAHWRVQLSKITQDKLPRDSTTSIGRTHPQLSLFKKMVFTLGYFVEIFSQLSFFLSNMFRLCQVDQKYPYKQKTNKKRKQPNQTNQTNKPKRPINSFGYTHITYILIIFFSDSQCLTLISVLQYRILQLLKVPYSLKSELL